ncbi:MAG TPA: cell envelope biogenesis protein TolA [Xanthobacteraceae bacterium]|jgi:colicin import membrane protein
MSAIGHAAVLLWSIWSLAANPLPVSSTEGLPVDLISADDFSKIAAGMKDAPKAETPKPLVEKVAEANPVDDPTAKVVEKKEVKAAREPPPAAESKPAETKSEQKQADAKPDPVTDAPAKEEAKKPEQKKAEVKPPLPPKKPAPPAHKFDPKQVAALLDKRDSTRLAAAGEALNNSPSLGLSNGTAAQLSLSELEGLRARLAQLWAIPAGAKDPQELIVQVRIKLRPDGTLAGPPMVLTSGKTALFVAARDSAIRALFRGQPFDMLRPEHYEQWKDIEITFDPRDMIRG